MKLKVVLYPEDEGGYSAEVPALPGCFSQGDTLEEALANIKEAAECWLDAVASQTGDEAEPGARVLEIEL
jgi:predicted RNase H-like HicB family nuclease